MSDVQKSVEAVWRMESARLVAGLVRVVRDVGLAEDLAQDALVAALQQWPESGVPRSPGAWLMTVAKRKAVDQFRRAELHDRRQAEIAHATETEMPDVGAALEDTIEDDMLRLMFICCHPVLGTEARVALTLRLVGGLTTREIAHAHLVPEATMAQRIVRAKRTLADARVPFEEPTADERAQRVASVQGVLYLVFNEGYAATSGADWMRPLLCEEALRLGRMLAALVPQDPEVHGLVALMEIQASRSRARLGPTGEAVLLLDQDRGRWDQLLIRRGMAALERATALGGAYGPYALQAAIAACHARARTAEATDWSRIADLYAALVHLMPTPVVQLNRAVAVAMADGAAAGLALVDTLATSPALTAYHLLPSVRGDLLHRLGRFDEARAEFERAALLTQNARERDLLARRGADLAPG